MTDVLILRGVTRHHAGRARAVLDGVDLRAAAGELVGIVGANGAGKSTLLAVAAGLRRSEGEVVLQGRCGWMGEAGPIRRSVDELLALVAGVHGVGDVAALRRRMPLSSGPVEGLSAGQRRLVLLGAAVIHEPAVLLLDEPLTHLDAAGQRVVHDVIAQERARGAAVVVATHFPDAFAFDRVLTLADGRWA